MVYRLFTDSKILEGRKHIELLIPFFGDVDKDSTHPQFGRFSRLLEQGKEHFSLIEDPSLSDFFVFPYKWQKNDKNLSDFVELAKKNNKKVLLFFNDDSDAAIDVDPESVIVFRTSFYRSTKRENELAIPGWSPDYGGFSPRNKSRKPVVGFCGCASNNVYRLGSLKALFQSDLVADNFILHDRFWAGWDPTDKTKENQHFVSDARSKFLRNMEHSDYVLCARGSGNFSYRLYETLSAGRVPIIIDSDVVLPHHNDAPWKKNCLIVGTKDIGLLGQIVSEHYASMTDDSFVDKQIGCRSIYENYIRPIEFFKKFMSKREV